MKEPEFDEAEELGGREDKAEAGNAPAKKNPRFIIIPILVLGLAAAIVYYAHSKTKIVTDDAYVHATVYSVSPRMPGEVVEVLAATNRMVEADELLVRLDPEEYDLKVRVAQAALDAARTQYEEASIGERATKAQEKLVEAQLAQADLDLERAETLIRKNGISQEKYDRAVTEKQILAARMEVSRANVAVAKAKISSALTLIENAQTQLENAQLLRGYTEIRSPGRGIITNKSVEVGNIVQPGFPILSVVDLEDLWIEANFKETQLQHVRPGLRAEIKVDTYPGSILEGHVESIEAGSGAAFSLFPSENASGNWVKVVQRIPTKILLDNHDRNGNGPVLRVGMSTQVAVIPDELPFLPRLFSFLPGF